MSKKKWLVIGHYGGQNTGDEAMLLGLVAGCTPSIRKRLLIVTKEGVLPSVISELGVRAVPAHITEVLRQLFCCHGVIVGGGSHFQDDYSLLRYLRHFRYMARYVVIAFLATVLRKKVLWLSMGFGPFLRKATKWLTRLGIRFCNYVTVRESASATEIGSWVDKNKYSKTFDLAALMPVSETALLEDDPVPEDSTRLTLGLAAISVKSLESKGVYVESSFWHMFSEALADIYRTHQELHVSIFVIRGGQREDDEEINGKIYTELLRIDPVRVSLVPYDPNPLRTFERIKQCKTFIATRFHSAVLAYLAECNLLVLSYHRKVTDLAREIELPAQAHLEISGNTSVDTLREAIRHLLCTPDQYQARLPVAEAIKRAARNIEIIRKFS